MLVGIDVCGCVLGSTILCVQKWWNCSVCKMRALLSFDEILEHKRTHEVDQDIQRDVHALARKRDYDDGGDSTVRLTPMEMLRRKKKLKDAQHA